MMRRLLLPGLAALCLLRPGLAHAQAPAPAEQDTTRAGRDTILEDGLTAGEADGEPRRRRLVKWNEYEGPFITFRFGAGFLVDYTSYLQDEASKEQFSLEPGYKLRDFRLIMGGRIKTKRRITYQAGLMYDAPTKSWFVRQTGFMVAVPELWGHFFIGRSKAGISENRVMVGYDGWGIERAPISETIPLLADGVKWLGYLPSRHLLWNLGWFTDLLSEGQSFSYFDNQVAARIIWVPMVSDSVGKLVHIGLNLSTGKPNEGKLQVRSRPENFLAPYFLDTGKFPAQRARQVGLEAYYRPGPWLFGAESYLEKVESPEAHDPTFRGSDFVVSWLITGETRRYNTVGGYFKAVSPAKTLFEGGPGAWEAVLRYSYTNLNSGTLQGGKFWRITPMVNWHMSDNARLEFVYGYGTLDRFELKGKTQFFQSRIQLQF
jgi:phosphate-selective porin OprO and OprP